MVEKRTLALTALLICGLLLGTGAIALVVVLNDHGSESTTGAATDTESHLSAAAHEAWMGYRDGSAPTLDTGSMLEVDDNASIELVEDLVGQEEFVTHTNDGGYGGGNISGADAGAGAADEGDSNKDASPQREVEEADIVKVVGDRMYILNPYRGLIIVDISQPDSASIISRVEVKGYPVEMYVVDYLAIIITNLNYRYWYFYDLYTDGGIDAQENIGSQLLVVNIFDEKDPYIAKSFDLSGFSSDSRRVGDVIYAVTNTYNWYGYQGYMDMEDATNIVSVDLADPGSVSIRDRVSFKGSSNQIHVTSDTIYVAASYYDGSYYDHGAEDAGGETMGVLSGGNASSGEAPKAGTSGGSSTKDRDDDRTHGVDDNYYYKTCVTYVDISDARGDIKVRDNFTMPGYLNDRYMMDYYSANFRCITHFYDGMGSSQLWIWDVSDPDDITVEGKLLIDDAGSLMATRFAGERAYTIHLPHSIDPLDVLDLSDPSNPKLCDMFEMPGWITHMHVIGNHIIALGVDSSDGGSSVVVSLFDVTDPDNVVMEDRVHVGEGRTYSNANWDPKAFTIVEEEGLVMVPFVSYDDSWHASYGFQMVSYDLEDGDLEQKGSITGIDSITRTRYHSGYILASSDSTLQVVDASDTGKPEVVVTVELSANIVDSVFNGNVNVQLVRNWQEDVLRLRTTDEYSYDLGVHIDEVSLDAQWGSMLVDGGDVIVYGSRYNDNVDMDSLWIDRCTGFVAQYTVSSTGTISLAGTWETPSGHQIEYLDRLDDDTLVAVDSGSYGGQGWLWMLDSAPDSAPLQIAQLGLNGTVSRNPFFLEGDILMFSDNTQEYWYERIPVEDTERNLTYYSYRYHYNYTYSLESVDLSDRSAPVVLPGINIPGTLVGADASGSFIYTRSDRYDGNGSYLYTTLDSLSVDRTAGKCVMVSAFKLPDRYASVTVVDDMAFIQKGSYYGWGYGGAYGYEMDGRSQSYYGSDTSSLVIVDLSNPSSPVLRAGMELNGSFVMRYSSGDLVVLWDAGTGTVLVIGIDGGGINTMGACTSNGNVNSVRVSSGYIDIIMGRYGVRRMVMGGV